MPNFHFSFFLINTVIFFRKSRKVSENVSVNGTTTVMDSSKGMYLLLNKNYFFIILIYKLYDLVGENNTDNKKSLSLNANTFVPNFL